MNIAELPLETLQSDPTNIRGEIRGVSELAESIAEYGLLQNLVVREVDTDLFVVLGGNRRLAAIQLLAKQGRWTSGVPCLVLGSKGTFEALIENVAREDVPIWRLGRRYIELCEAGFEQQEIAVRLHRSPGHISQSIKVAAGLAPKVIGRLERMAHGALSNHQIIRIAKLREVETLQPDEKAQITELERQLGIKRSNLLSRGRPRRKKPEREVVYARFKKLQKGVSVPAHALPYVDSMVRYLKGEDSRLKFK